MKTRVLFVGLATALLSLGCPSGEGNIGGVLVVSTVEVSPGITDIFLGATSQFSATPKTSTGIAVTGRSVTWSTSDPAVATVSATGLVTGMQVGGPVRIRASVDGITGDAVVTVRPVPVDHVTVTPAESGILVNSQKQLTAHAFDAAGVELTGRSFAWTSSASGIAAVSSTGLVFGIAEGGPVTISATSEGKTGTAAVSVSTRPATRLGILQPFPTQLSAGQSISPAIRVALQDDFLATVLGATNPVTIALAGNCCGATLSGTTTRAAVNGVATFNDLVLNRVGTSYTFLVTSPGLASATSNPFDVIAGTGNQLTFSILPSSTAQSGVALSLQPVLQLRDASGNPVAQAGVVISAGIASGPAGGSLGGTLAAITNGEGIAAFSNLTLTGPAGSYTLSFGASGVATLTSGTITLGAGPATQLFIATQPASGAQSGVPLAPQPAIQLRDPAGNPVPQAGIVVTASIASGPAGAVLTGATATTAGNGLASFTSLTINGSNGTYTMSFSSPGLAGATSGAIVLGAGAPTQLAITTQPSTTAVNGVPLTQQPVVQLRDASNNAVALAGVQITATISAGGSLSGTTNVNTSASGTATFTNLGITGPVSSYTLTFTASGLTPKTSNSITLSAGSATNLAANSVTAQSATVGTAAVPPSVKVTDANGNPVAGFEVRFAVTAGGGTVTPASPTAVNTNASGIATATSWILGPTAGTNNNTVTATATGLAGSPVTFTASGTAATATAIAANSATNQSATVATAVAAPPSVKVTDTNGNPVPGVSVIFTITAGGGTLNPASPATVVTNPSGVATVTSWTLGTVAGTNNNTLTAAAGGLAGSPVGFTASAVAGSGNKITIFTQPSATAQNRVNFAQAPVIQLADNLDNPVPTANVSVSVLVFSGLAATLTPATALTDANGRAAFSPFSMAGVVGTRTLFFAASGYTSSPPTVSIVLSAGAATNIAANSAVSQSGTVGTPVSAPPSVKVTDPDGNGVSGVPVVFTVTAGGGTTSPASPATINTNSSGIATLTSWTLGPLVGTNNNTLTASSSGLAGSPVTFTASGTAPVPTTITANSSTTQSATVNTAVGAPPSVRVTDASGNGVAGVSVTFTLTAGGGTLSPSSPAVISTDASGIATVTSWTLGTTAGTNNNTVTATASGLTGSPVTFTASGTAGTPTQITYLTQPSSSATNDVPFSTQPVLLVRDTYNNNVPGAVVTAAISSAPAGSSSLIGSVTATTASNGRATFSGLGIVGPVGNYKLRFSTNAGALNSPESSTIALAAGAVAIITANSATTQSATVNTAVSAPPSVKVTDTGGNPKGSVAVTFTVTTGGGTLSPVSPASINTNPSGIATVTSWTLGSTAGTNNNIVTATSSGLTGSPVTFTASGVAGAPTQLTYNTQPSTTANSGAAFATQPVLLLKDAANNPVGSTVVTATITGSPAGVSFVGTPTATTNSSGVATFVGLGLSGPVGSYTVSFTSGAATSAASNNIALSAGAATQLTYNTQPSAAANSGAAFAQQPALLVRDAANNPVGSALVTATITTFPGSASFVGTPSATSNSSGVATFVGLGLSGPVGSYKLTFTSGAASSAASNTITLSAGAAANIVANSATSQSDTAGTAVSSPPSVKVTDAAGNPKGSISVTFTVTSGGGTTVPASPAALMTNGSGIATLTSWTLGPAAGTNNNTVTATSTGLTGSPVAFTASGTAGAPTQMAITQQPSSSAASGTVFAQQPIIQVKDANNNPVSGVSVTVAIQTGVGGTLGGATTKVTDSSGNATFMDLKITGSGTYTLRFSATGPPPVDSSVITITP